MQAVNTGLVQEFLVQASWLQELVPCESPSSPPLMLMLCVETGAEAWGG